MLKSDCIYHFLIDLYPNQSENGKYNLIHLVTGAWSPSSAVTARAKPKVLCCWTSRGRTSPCPAPLPLVARVAATRWQNMWIRAIAITSRLFKVIIFGHFWRGGGAYHSVGQGPTIRCRYTVAEHVDRAIAIISRLFWIMLTRSSDRIFNPSHSTGYFNAWKGLPLHGGRTCG